MILDKANLFSDAQAVTDPSYSDSVIDLGASGRGKGEPVEVFCQVVADFIAGETVTVTLETASDEAFTSPVTLKATGAVATASLKAGYRFSLGTLPEGALRYVRLKYDTSETLTAGAITAGLAYDVQTNG